jgi:hypothetical protein
VFSFGQKYFLHLSPLFIRRGSLHYPVDPP